MDNRLGQSSEHDSCECDGDPTCRAALGLLVVSNQSSVLHQPAECSLNHPPLGQDFETLDIVASLDHSDCDSRRLPLHPVGEIRATVATVHPQPPESPKRRHQGRQERLRPDALRHVGWNDDHSKQKSKRVDNDEALSAFGLLARIVANLATMCIGANGLAVENRCRRFGLSAILRSNQSAQSVVDEEPCAVLAPPPETVVDRFPRGKGLWEQAPGAPAFDQIQNRIEQGPQGRRRTPNGLARREKRFDESPLCVRKVGVVGRVLHRPDSAAAKCGQRPLGEMSTQYAFRRHNFAKFRVVLVPVTNPTFQTIS